MSIRFTRLQIAGFKSFSDPISIDILPGLTGIIGPNGCGKSNIVEAIRWVMGESSARSLRGEGMNDVIFAGTARRAPRNIAEVTLTLEGTEKVAPAPFQNMNELQISRQIERDMGSNYRINGKIQRARDIQTLFADLGSGPRSSALISQNHIAQLISASPEERRQVLEEAAGIAGLHSRRREAELKLRATEENLKRLDDIRQQLFTQMEALTAQAEQASLYRQLSAHLRDTELLLQKLYFQRAYRKFVFSRQKLEKAQKNQQDTSKQVEEIRESLSGNDNTLTTAKQTETQTRIQWEQWNKKVNHLRDEKTQLESKLAELHERLQESNEDHQSAQKRVTDSENDLNRLQEQYKATQKAILDTPQKETDIQSHIQQIEKDSKELQQKLARTEHEFVEKQKQNQHITQCYEQSLQRYQTLQTEYERLTQEYEQCLADLPTETALNDFNQNYQKAKSQSETLLQERQAIETQLNDAKLNEANLRHQSQQLAEKHNHLQEQCNQQSQRLKNLQQAIQQLKNQQLSLQKNLLDQSAKDAFDQQIQQARETLQQLKQTLENENDKHQQAIKNRLEQEAIFSENLRNFKNQQTELTNTEKNYTQAEEQFKTLTDKINIAKQALVPMDQLENQHNLVKNLEDEFTKAQSLNEQLTNTQNQVKQALENAQIAWQKLEAEILRQQARQEGLAAALANHDQMPEENLPPILSLLTIPSGLENAIAAIFDETLECPEQIEGKKGWATLPLIDSPDPLPEPAIPLIDLMSVPTVLKRAFQAIGVVPDHATGQKLFSKLNPGQSLVTRDGDLWQWHGYHQNGGIANKAAQRLIQHQNLREAQALLEKLSSQAPQLKNDIQQAEEDSNRAKQALSKQKDYYQQTEKAYQKAQNELLNLENQYDVAQNRLEALQPAYDQTQEQLNHAKIAWENAKKNASTSAPNDDAVQIACQNEKDIEHVVQQLKIQLNQAEIALNNLQNHIQQTLQQDQKTKTRLESLEERLQLHVKEEQSLNEALETLNEQQSTLDDLQVAQTKTQQAKQQIELLTQTLDQVNQTYQKATHNLSECQKALQNLKEHYNQQQGRIETLKPHHETLKQSLDTAKTEFQIAEENYQNRSDLTLDQQALENLRQKEQQYRQQEEQYRLTYHLLLSEKETLQKQQLAQSVQIKEWDQRIEAAQKEADLTQQRLENLHQQYQTLSVQPDELSHQLQDALNHEQETETLYIKAQNERHILEQKQAQDHQNLRQLEEEAIQAKENLLKAEGKLEQAEALLAQYQANIPPESVSIFTDEAAQADISDGFEDQLKQSLHQNSEQRELLSAVNLRAEIEHAEKQSALDELNREYEELSLATQQLHESIQKLNRQGRNKLNAIFSEVDHHFQELFSRMFNGGHAHLKLLPNDDPLQSGLEIYAQPPGKKLSTLSLLSGGEQALTALSLVFAVSRCNPVPICVLDEVDAPLDDPNVERFCALLNDMTEQAGTRFLVVTHHQLTMTHMHRLYGITMQERGVSQVLSVDLERAIHMQETIEPEKTHA